MIILELEHVFALLDSCKLLIRYKILKQNMLKLPCNFMHTFINKHTFLSANFKGNICVIPPLGLIGELFELLEVGALSDFVL